MPGTDIGKAYIQIVPSTGGIEGAIQSMLDPEAERAGNSAGGKFSNAFGGFLKGAAAVATTAIASATTGIVALTKSAYDSYADYEQLVGGVETLFGSAYTSVEEFAENEGISLDYAAQAFERYQSRQETVLNNASNAYMTAGLSANEYMETVTGFAAALNNSLGENAWQSANYADMAIIDMSDNANKMGTSMESIQNAYMGFSKQNFTMLDNLKLGYGGTKTEMERLLHDAEEIAGYEFGSLDVNNFANVVEAINIIQNDLGIAGTTAKEAASTLSGSASMVGAAWSNLVTGLGDENADISGLIDNLLSSVTSLLSNATPRIEQIFMGISTMVTELLPQVISMAIDIITNNLPTLLDASVQMIDAIGKALIDNAPKLMDAALLIVTTIADLIMNNLPTIIELGVTLLISLIEGITAALPDLINSIVELIPTIVNTLINYLPLILKAGMDLLLGLIKGIISALPELIKTLPQIIDTTINTLLGMLPEIIECGVELLTALVDNLPAIIDAIVTVLPEIIDAVISALIDNTPVLVDAGFKLFTALVDNLPQIIVEICKAIPEIIKNICNALIEKWPDIQKAGQDLFEQIWNKAPEILADLKKQCVEFVKGMIDAFKGEITSIEEVGKNLIEGLWNGIESMGSWIGDKVKGFGDGVLSDLKDFFGIESPSKVMRDEVGKFIPEGMAIGITTNADAVTAAMDELSNNALSTAKASISGNIGINSTNISNIDNSFDVIISLLSLYLPIIADASRDVNISLEGGADRLFDIVRERNQIFTKSTGYNPLVNG